MAEDVERTEGDQEDFEIVLLAVMVIASIFLGYRNRARIKSWFNDLLGKFK